MDLLSSSEEETLPFEECLILDLIPPVEVVARRRRMEKSFMLEIIILWKIGKMTTKIAKSPNDLHIYKHLLFFNLFSTIILYFESLQINGSIPTFFDISWSQ